MQQFPRRQQGLALVVSLMILTLVTVAGVATMETTGMQLKMSNASRDRQEAFEVTEAALRMVEEKVALDNNGDNLAQNTNMHFGCSGDECYTFGCDNGRCFQGYWDGDDDEEQCKSIDDGGIVTPPETSPWETGPDSDGYLNVWTNEDRHLEVEVSVGKEKITVPYIIEFRCFTPPDSSAKLSASHNAQLFRITARGTNVSGSTEVMLQSTYKRTK
jgi:type IV pilus assembly protein PilX